MDDGRGHLIDDYGCCGSGALGYLIDLSNSFCPQFNWSCGGRDHRIAARLRDSQNPATWSANLEKCCSFFGAVLLVLWNRISALGVGFCFRVYHAHLGRGARNTFLGGKADAGTGRRRGIGIRRCADHLAAGA